MPGESAPGRDRTCDHRIRRRPDAIHRGFHLHLCPQSIIPELLPAPWYATVRTTFDSTTVDWAVRRCPNASPARVGLQRPVTDALVELSTEPVLWDCDGRGLEPSRVGAAKSSTAPVVVPLVGRVAEVVRRCRRFEVSVRAATVAGGQRRRWATSSARVPLAHMASVMSSVTPAPRSRRRDRALRRRVRLRPRQVSR